MSQTDNSLSTSVGTAATHSDNPSPTQVRANCGVVKRLTLDQKCQIGPQQTCSVRVKVSNGEPTESVGIITSNEEVLAAHQCDILDGFWTGDSQCYVPVINWGYRKEVLLVTLITANDHVWEEEPCPTVATITPARLIKREVALLMVS